MLRVAHRRTVIKLFFELSTTDKYYLVIESFLSYKKLNYSNLSFKLQCCLRNTRITTRKLTFELRTIPLIVTTRAGKKLASLASSYQTLVHRYCTEYLQDQDRFQFLGHHSRKKPQ
jgi:hypothetical protein